MLLENFTCYLRISILQKNFDRYWMDLNAAKWTWTTTKWTWLFESLVKLNNLGPGNVLYTNLIINIAETQRTHWVLWFIQHLKFKAEASTSLESWLNFSFVLLKFCNFFKEKYLKISVSPVEFLTSQLLKLTSHPAPDRADWRSSILSVAFFGTMMHLRGASLAQRRLFWPEEFQFSSEALNFRAPLS